MNSRVLVTGHLGYLGSALVPRLLEAGFDTTGSDTDLFRRCNYGQGPMEPPNLGIDVRDLGPGDLEGFDAIIHLAGLSNDPLGELNPRLTREINFKATVRLANLAKQAGVSRFIFSSSCSTYGQAGKAMIDETATLNPVTAYGRSKVDAEEGLALLASDDFSPVYLRNATVYGHSPRIRFDLVVNNLVAWAHTTGRVLLKSKGLAWRPLVHVEDVVSAFVAVLKAPRENIHNVAINIGLSSQNFRVHEVAEKVVRAMPGTRLDMLPGAPVDERTYRVNCDKARRLLDEWQPCWGLERGIEHLVHTYRKLGLGREDFEGARYQRVAHLKGLLASGEIDNNLRSTCNW